MTQLKTEWKVWKIFIIAISIILIFKIVGEVILNFLLWVFQGSKLILVIVLIGIVLYFGGMKLITNKLKG